MITVKVPGSSPGKVKFFTFILIHARRFYTSHTYKCPIQIILQRFYQESVPFN